MPGDNALCSSAALINSQYPAEFAANFPMKRRSRGREFKSTLLHTSVSMVSDIGENRSKSARVRAICDGERTQRTYRAVPNLRNLAKPIPARFS
jgi:hypothetical protein